MLGCQYVPASLRTLADSSIKGMKSCPQWLAISPSAVMAAFLASSMAVVTNMPASRAPRPSGSASSSESSRPENWESFEP